jgi:hypothetical protein
MIRPLKLVFCLYPSFTYYLSRSSSHTLQPQTLAFYSEHLSFLLWTSFHFVPIYTQDWDRQNPTQIVTEMCGFVTILSGTFLLHKTKDMADGATISFLAYCHFHVPLLVACSETTLSAVYGCRAFEFTFIPSSNVYINAALQANRWIQRRNSS